MTGAWGVGWAGGWKMWAPVIKPQPCVHFSRSQIQLLYLLKERSFQTETPKERDPSRPGFRAEEKTRSRTVLLRDRLVPATVGPRLNPYWSVSSF